MITYNSDGTRVPRLQRRKTGEWIRAVAERYGRRVGEVAYVFCSDERILEVNREYLQHDYFTDIITFDYCEEGVISGDVFVSVDTVRSNAGVYGVGVDEELRRVMIHGVLHLCGLDDGSEAERAAMRAAEDEALVLWSEMV